MNQRVKRGTPKRSAAEARLLQSDFGWLSPRKPVERPVSRSAYSALMRIRMGMKPGVNPASIITN